MELLQVENLSAGYGNRTVVREVSFSAKKGEIVGIFGENGCGKTTLFRAVLGLGTRMSGQVTVTDQDMNRISVRKRARFMAMLPSVVDIPEGILADEVLEMGWYAQEGFFRGADEKARKRKEQIIHDWNLEPLMNQYFEKLSQGQKQRVLLGRMLLQDTPIFLMDEPDTSLDFRHKHSLFQNMRSVVQREEKAGVTILHDPSLAMTYCDRVYLMKKGTFIGSISPKEETIEEIAKKIRPITGNVTVTRKETSVIIFP